MLSELVEALQIFLKYGDVKFPTNCQHDELRVFPATADLSPEDVARLEELGFTQDSDITEAFISYRFGSN